MKNLKKLLLSLSIYAVIILLCSAKSVRFKTTVMQVGQPKEYADSLYMYCGQRINIQKIYGFEDVNPYNSQFAEIENCVLEAKKEGSTSICSDGKKLYVQIFGREYPELSQYRVVVYKKSQSVTVYASDSSGKFTVPVKTMVCSTGKEGENETKIGTFKVTRRYRWHLLYGPCYGQYCTAFSPSYLFHSLPYSEKSPDTVYDYELLGEKSSHGCVRLCARDAQWIYENVNTGSVVEIVDGFGEFTPAPVPAESGEEFAGWDPTDTDAANPYSYYGLQYEPVCAASCSRLNLFAGEEVYLSIYTTADNYIITSDNDGVAAVSEDGKITALSPGSCTVYIMGCDSSSYRLTVTVD